MIFLIDAAAVIGDVKDRKSKLCAAPNPDVAADAGLEIFESVVDQIGKNLLQRQAVAGNFRQRSDMDLRLCFRRLMRNGGHDSLDQLVRVDTHRIEFAASLTREIEDQ